jgi:hypothetical protein
MNKVRLSKVTGQDTINAFLGGQGAYTQKQSDVLASSLLEAAESVASASDLGGIGTGISSDYAAEGVSDGTKQLRDLQAFINSGDREAALTAVKEKIETGGLGVARITNDVAASAENTLGAVAERKRKRYVNRWKNF